MNPTEVEIKVHHESLADIIVYCQGSEGRIKMLYAQCTQHESGQITCDVKLHIYPSNVTQQLFLIGHWVGTQSKKK